MTRRFALRRCWATRLLWPLVRGEPFAEVGDGRVRVEMGWLGRAEFDAGNVERLSRMRWPWWGGIGVRLGRKMVAYATAWGDAAVIELAEPINVRAPLKWTTKRVIVGVVDVDEFLRAVAHARVRREPDAPG